MIRTNPNIYEINTRVWIKRFADGGDDVHVSDIPRGYWLDLKAKGIDAIWLMGIWRTNEEAVKQYCFEEGLMHEYSKALKDWHEEDVIGSPYAIDSYEINPKLGTELDLLKLKETLNEMGMKLILDFVPNHFSVGSKLLKSKPEIFLTADKHFFDDDPYTFFKPFPYEEKYFAHGRDPFFPAWQDTAQVNYYSEEAREFMINQLLKITKFADGVRCDMAMLAMNNVFGNTWSGALSSGFFSKPKDEFWQTAIEIIKNYRNDFLFIAEAYWDLEYDLQQLGFDYTYDKKLLDRIIAGDVNEIKAHLNAEEFYRRKSVRFIENHDEERSIVSMGKKKSAAAAIIISAIEGMHLYNDGQFEGKKVKLPVQLGREPEESPIEYVYDFYDNLLKITNDDIFHKGFWFMRNPQPAGPGDETYKNMLVWSWRWLDEKRLVVINFSNVKSRCRIQLELGEYPSSFKLWDLLNKIEYVRSTKEVEEIGLFIELEPYSSHIFTY